MSKWTILDKKKKKGNVPRISQPLSQGHLGFSGVCAPVHLFEFPWRHKRVGGPLNGDAGLQSTRVPLADMYYNFARIHSSLRCSPAMAAGVSNALWSIEDIVKLLD